MPNISSDDLVSKKEPLIKLLKNPVFVYSGHLYSEKQNYIPKHKHDDITEILLVTSGQTSFYFAEKEYSAKAGDIIIFNSGVQHEEFYFGADIVETYYCGISNIYVDGFKEKCLLPENLPPVLQVGDEYQFVRTIFCRLFEEACMRRSGFDIVCGNLVLILTVFVVRLINEKIKVLYDSDQTDAPYMLYERIKQYLDANYMRNFNVIELAKEFSITPSYLAHIFKKYNGMPPIRYQTARRIDEAKRLLSCSNLRVSTIASVVGYENVNSFFEPFRKFTEMTPNEYRDMLNKRFDEGT